MVALIDMSGQKYNRLTVHKYIGRSMWECICECGCIVKVSRSNLTSGQVQSCGCLAKDILQTRNTTHGLSKSPEYKSWSLAKNRCFNQKAKDYPLYGGRGISMCQQWINSFECFIADMGYRPSPNHSLDRIDNDKGYEPANCRWVDKVTQAQNRRTTTMVTAFGETKSYRAWLDDPRCNVSKYITLRARIYEYGWSAEKAITTKERINK